MNKRLLSGAVVAALCFGGQVGAQPAPAQPDT